MHLANERPNIVRSAVWVASLRKRGYHIPHAEFISSCRLLLKAKKLVYIHYALHAVLCRLYMRGIGQSLYVDLR